MATTMVKTPKISDNALDCVLFLMLLFLVFAIGWGTVYIIYPEGDVMEHIYDTFMVSEGYVPYRDFFEHHHPLLWYLMVPLVRLLDRNVEIIGIADYVTFCFFVTGLYFIYRIVVDFLSTRTAALLALIYILVPNIFMYYVYFKPDNWLLPCVAGGVFFYFRYLRDLKRVDLVVAFLLFFIAFLFIQKALLYYPIILCWVLYALYKKEMKWRDFFAALILPITLCGMFLGYFYYYDALKQYFTLNFMFNDEMRQYFGEQYLSRPFYMAWVILGGSLIVSVCLYKYENKYFRAYSLLVWLLLVEKALYFSPYVYYWYEAYYFALPIAASGVIRLSEKIRALLYIVVFETLVYASFMGYYVVHDVAHIKTKYRLSGQEIFLSLTNKCDEWVGFNGGSLSLFNRNLAYYWFLQGHVDVFGEKMGLHPVEDINALIQKYKPRVILVDRVNERYSDNEQKKVIHEPDMKMIEKYYYPSRFASDDDGIDFKTLELKKLDFKRGIWLLKSEYRKKQCVFDEKKKRWHYADN